MLICVLGPIAIRSASGSLFAPTGQKQRLLLASLYLKAPHPVSSARLIHTLWGDDLPSDPGGALRTQIARLRTFLAQANAAERLQLHPPAAYALDISEAESDAGLLAQYRNYLREANSPEHTIALAEQAEALWRGSAFGELHDLVDFVGEAARLEDIRAAVEETRVETLLAVGRASEALAVIERMVKVDPLRERPRALAMQALDQLGRRRDALAVFQEFRRLLSEELGLDPSPSLRKLETSIIQNQTRSAQSVSESPGTEDSQRARVAAVPNTPAQPTREHPRTLPLALTSLIGRDDDQREVQRMLGTSRLVTLTGTGGSGKTRLALETARARSDLVYWTELGDIADPAFISHAIAAALGIREYTGRSRTATLVAELRARPGVLVLDNCEHLVRACASLVETLLRECPGLVVLATSREPLGIVGEAIWPLRPLALPAHDAREPETIARFEAVMLLRDRARAVRPDFGLTHENCEAIVAICRRLDGLPLALELAAARLRHLSPQEVARRLERDVGLLTAGRTAVIGRHQTLRDAIDWSYRLLSDAERVLLQRMSVFPGGADLAAIEAIVVDSALPDADALLDLVSSLVDKSLVVAQSTNGRTRYRLLETVRSCAAEYLVVSGDATAIRERHASHFAGRVDQAEPLLMSARRAETCRHLEEDRENIRAAIAWALGSPSGAEVAHRMVGALWWFWHYVGRFAEARRWATTTLGLDTASVDARLRARVEYTAAMASWLLGEPAKACVHAEESARLARLTTDASLLVRSISAHAFALRDVGEVTRAKALAAECVGVARQAGFPPADMGFALWIQCTALLESGEVEPAEAAAREAAMLWRATGDNWGLSMVLNGMGMAELGRGNLDAAAEHFREAIGLLRADGEPYFIARCLEGLAIARVHQGHLILASRLFGAAEALRESIGAPLLPFEQARYTRTIEILVPALATQRGEDAWAQGRMLDLNRAVALSLEPVDEVSAGTR